MQDFPFKLKEDEKIKQIEKYPDYWISNYGRIFSFKSTRKKNNGWHLMKNRIKHKRYEYIFLSKNNCQYEFSIHYLVAKYFLPKPNQDNLVIDHLDANGLNNYYKNLEWVTQEENIHRSYKTSGINQLRNYCIYNIIYPDNTKSKDLISRSEVKQYVKENNLDCSALSLIRWGYSRNFKIERRNKNAEI